MTGADAIAIIILLLIFIAVGVYLLHWLYRHSSKDQAFVRTGSGGEKVVMGGGALVIPIIHDITRVNMNAVPIEIKRTGVSSLITRNKMRVDVTGEFSVRVIPTKEDVSLAARTFGERTASADQMKDVIQGRFVDAMSAVAASMSMEDIHTNRKEFMAQVSARTAAARGSCRSSSQSARGIRASTIDGSGFFAKTAASIASSSDHRWRSRGAGSVTTSAPIFAHSNTWMGCRMLAQRTLVLKPYCR